MTKRNFDKAVILNLNKQLIIAGFIVLSSSFLSFNSFAQAGIYSESDIEFQDLFIQAQLEKQKGNYDKEIKILKQIIKRDKSCHAGYYELSQAYVKTDDLVSAEKNAKKAIQFDDNNIWYKILLADIYEASTQYKQAIPLLKKLRVTDELNFDYVDRIVNNYMQLGDHKNAILTLQEIENKKGITPIVSLRMFEIYDSIGNVEKAELTLEKLAERFPKKIQILSRQAHYLMSLEKNEKAVSIHKKILELDPSNEFATLSLNRLQSRSESSSELADLSKIIRNENISLDNKIKELMPHLSRMSSDGEDNKMLQAISKDLIELYPNEAKSYAVRGDVLFYSSDYVNAEKAYSRAIELDDRKYSLWDQWMINLWELESYNKLEEVSLEAIDYFPNQVNPLIFNSIALTKNNGKEEAKEMLAEASFISGDNIKYKDQIIVVSCWININLIPTQEIKNEIIKVQEDRLTTAIHFELLGDIYHHLSDVSKSKSNWQKAIEYGGSKNRLNKKIGV
ncbi:MAG: hypothetical protein HKN51_01835 [Saprospiraceae bacterium]|nr:hypothetical protein [Saprospiraceae bacterium]